MNENIRNWRNLAAGVVNLAFLDRKKAEDTLRTNPESECAKHMLTDCDSFFRSRWCETLLDFLNVNVNRDRLMEVVNGR